MNDKQFLQEAITKAKESVAQGGFPAGAIIVKNGEIIGNGISIGGNLNDPTAHGEMTAIRDACKNLKKSDLAGSVLYTSMQPCLMCFGAAIWSAIPKIIFACSKERVSDDYYGGHYQLSAINLELTHPIEIVHFIELEEDSLAIVREWEKSLRK